MITGISIMEVGSVLISVDERVLQDAMKGTGSEIFVLEQDGRVLSAPNNSMIGSTIRLDQISRIGNRSYSEYKAASVTNEKSGWNIVEFYPLSHYQKTMRDQFWLQVGMVFGVCIVLVSAVLIVIHPVIVSVEAVLKAMHRVEEGDFTTLGWKTGQYARRGRGDCGRLQRNGGADRFAAGTGQAIRPGTEKRGNIRPGGPN